MDSLKSFFNKFLTLVDLRWDTFNTKDAGTEDRLSEIYTTRETYTDPETGIDMITTKKKST